MWAAILISCWALFWQSFPLASVKVSQRIVGKDYGDKITFSPNGFSGRNVSLKRLIVEAYQVRPFQVTGGPNWLDTSEYDVEAKTDAVDSIPQLQIMLRALLTERFGLSLHLETRELKIYELAPEKGGPKLKRVDQGVSMQQFCNLLAVKLSIHVMDDPTKPGMASGPPVPVVDKTGLSGTYDIPDDVNPEPGADMFTLWQRKLHDLGLKLESRKAPVEMIVIDHAEKVPTGN
jgi:uncharacterized protein (TIGR03435 family)